jgi:hypothetical protein
MMPFCVQVIQTMQKKKQPVLTHKAQKQDDSEWTEF